MEVKPTSQLTTLKLAIYVDCMHCIVVQFRLVTMKLKLKLKLKLKQCSYMVSFIKPPNKWPYLLVCYSRPMCRRQSLYINTY